MARPLICFDWDGTIADSMPLCIEEIRLALRRMGLPELPESQIRRCNGPTYEQSVPILGIPDALGEEFLRQRKAAEMELVPTVQQLFPGVREMLTELAPLADLVIVSNGLAPYLDLSIRVTGLEGVFLRTEAFRPGRAKPDTLRAVLDDLCPCRAVMVGDRLGDIDAAVTCCIPAIAAAYGYGTEDEFVQAAQIARSVEELTEMLMKFVG